MLNQKNITALSDAELDLVQGGKLNIGIIAGITLSALCILGVSGFLGYKYKNKAKAGIEKFKKKTLVNNSVTVLGSKENEVINTTSTCLSPLTSEDNGELDEDYKNYILANFTTKVGAEIIISTPEGITPPSPHVIEQIKNSLINP